MGKHGGAPQRTLPALCFPQSSPSPGSSSLPSGSPAANAPCQGLGVQPPSSRQGAAGLARGAQGPASAGQTGSSATLPARRAWSGWPPTISSVAQRPAGARGHLALRFQATVGTVAGNLERPSLRCWAQVGRKGLGLKKQGSFGCRCRSRVGSVSRHRTHQVRGHSRAVPGATVPPGLRRPRGPGSGSRRSWGRLASRGCRAAARALPAGHRDRPAAAAKF